MIQSEGEEEIKFNLHLNEYWNSRGVSLAASIPIFDKEPINMFKLYKAVCKRGGGRVSNGVTQVSQQQGELEVDSRRVQSGNAGCCCLLQANIPAVVVPV